jgi:hypothetical protein
MLDINLFRTDKGGDPVRALRGRPKPSPRGARNASPDLYFIFSAGGEGQHDT